MQFARSCTLFCHFLPLLFVVQFSFKLSLSCGSRSGLGKRGPRKPLMLQQCVPDVFEQSQQASGPAKGKITRNSQDFAKLKANYNSAIVFQDEESTGADRLMSTRCKEKLNTLGNLVKDQWPNIKLVVTEAWDENDKHSKNSLHYEGRAVDLRLSDKDMPKIGLLGRLAIDAGFDWVCYEDRNHIHASVREDGYKDKTWDGCFSADSTVQLENNVDIAIDKLKIGDKVQVLKPNGRVGYSEVMMFADFKPRSLHARHVMIETEKPAKRITLTPNHLIYVKENNDSDTTQLKTKHAAFVSPGEYVLVSLHGQLLASRVKSVSLVKLTGMVAPVTMEGNIVVDGVLASCYAMIHDHNIAHLAFGPLRLAHNFVPNLWNTDSSIQDGMHWYAEMLMRLNRLLNVVQLS